MATEQEFEADEPQSVSRRSRRSQASIDNHSSTVTEEPVSRPRSPHRQPASAPPAVQRLSSSADPVPAAAPQAVSANSLGSADTSLTPPPRHLPSVQRAGTGSDAAPQWFTAARPIPVLRTIDSPGSQPPPRKPDTVTTKPAGDSGTTVQRSIDPGPVRADTTDATTPPPPARVPPSTPAESDGELPVVRTAETQQSTTAPPPVTAQRITANTEERDPAPRTGHSPAPDVVAQSLPDVTGQSRPAVEVQRLPVVEARPAATVAGAEPERRTPAMPSVQRAPSVVSANPLPGRSAPTVPEVHVEADEAPGRSDSWSAAAWESTPPGRAAKRPGYCRPVPHARQSTPPRRHRNPVWCNESRRPLSSRLPHRTEPDHQPRQAIRSRRCRPSYSEPRPPAGGWWCCHLCARVPPTHTTGRIARQGAPERSVLFDSPRPVGLQRMFGDNAKRTDSGTGFRPASSGSAGFTSAAFSPGDSSSVIRLPAFRSSRRPDQATTRAPTQSRSHRQPSSGNRKPHHRPNLRPPRRRPRAPHQGLRLRALRLPALRRAAMSRSWSTGCTTRWRRGCGPNSGWTVSGPAY